jgi:hypothetical protein
MAPPDATRRGLGQLCCGAGGLSGLLSGLFRRARDDASVLERIAERTFRITCKQFMDAHRCHRARLTSCCTHSGTFEADPRRYPFCWRWLFADARDRP